MDRFARDTVFVADVNGINQSLAGAISSLVMKFDFAEQGYEVPVTFGAWSIVPDGSGKRPWMRLPIASGTLTSGGAGG